MRRAHARVKPGGSGWPAAGGRFSFRAGSHSSTERGEPSGPPAWADVRSWALVGTLDCVVPWAGQLFVAQRAGAHIVEVRASRLSMISHPPSGRRLDRDAAHRVH